MQKLIRISGLSALLAILVLGQGLAQTKIGVVDMERVIAESNAGKNAAAKLQTIGKNIESEVKTPSASLEKEQKALQPLLQGKTPQQIQADPGLLSRFQSFQKQANTVAAQNQKAAQEMTLTQRKALSDLYAKADEAVERVRQQKGLDIVLAKTAVLRFGASVNITSDVINKLNETTGSIPVERLRLPVKTAAAAPAPNQ